MVKIALIQTRWIFLCVVIAIHSLVLFQYFGWLLGNIFYFFKLNSNLVPKIQFTIIGCYIFSIWLFASPIFTWIEALKLLSRKPSQSEDKMLRGLIEKLEVQRAENWANAKKGRYPKLLGAGLVMSTKRYALRLIDVSQIAAYAYGVRSIAISRAAIDQLGDEEIASILAHEIAHLNFDDTVYEARYQNARFPFSSIVSVIASISSVWGLFAIVVFFPILPLAIFQVLLARLFDFFNAIYSRAAEYRADEYSAWITGGVPNQSFFEYARKYDLVEGRTLIDHMSASHPATELRRDRVEQMTMRIEALQNSKNAENNN